MTRSSKLVTSDLKSGPYVESIYVVINVQLVLFVLQISLHKDLAQIMFI